MDQLPIALIVFSGLYADVLLIDSNLQADGYHYQQPSVTFSSPNEISFGSPDANVGIPNLKQPGLQQSSEAKPAGRLPSSMPAVDMQYVPPEGSLTKPKKPQTPKTVPQYVDNFSQRGSSQLGQGNLPHMDYLPPTPDSGSIRPTTSSCDDLLSGGPGCQPQTPTNNQQSTPQYQAPKPQGSNYPLQPQLNYQPQDNNPTISVGGRQPTTPTASQSRFGQDSSFNPRINDGRTPDPYENPQTYSENNLSQGPQNVEMQYLPPNNVQPGRQDNCNGRPGAGPGCRPLTTQPGVFDRNQPGQVNPQPTPKYTQFNDVSQDALNKGPVPNRFGYNEQSGEREPAPAHTLGADGYQYKVPSVPYNF